MKDLNVSRFDFKILVIFGSVANIWASKQPREFCRVAVAFPSRRAPVDTDTCFVHTGTFLPQKIDPTHFICVCECTAQFPRRAFTPTHFSSGKADMSAFRHIKCVAEYASKSVHLRWQIFCVAENAHEKCASVNGALVHAVSGGCVGNW